MRDLATIDVLRMYDVEDVYYQRPSCIGYITVPCRQAVSTVFENAAGFGMLKQNGGIGVCLYIKEANFESPLLPNAV